MSSQIWLKSPLRPAFAQYFPTFSADDIRLRAEILPVHLATHLTPPNIATYTEIFGTAWWDGYLQLGKATKAKLLGEVLLSVGFSSSVVSAIVSTERDLFIEENDRPIAFVNWTIPLKSGSALSAPGLVAHYIEDLLNADHHRTIVEIGAGSGYHLAVVAQLLPQSRLIGYEALQPLAASTGRLLRAIGLDAEVLPEAVDASGLAHLAPVSAVFMTASSPSDRRDEFTSLLEVGGVLTTVRPLTSAEYYAEPSDTWLHKRYSSFHEYSANGWSDSCVVTSLVKGAENQLRVHRELYGVTFVPWREKTIDGAEKATNSAIQELQNLSRR